MLRSSPTHPNGRTSRESDVSRRRSRNSLKSAVGRSSLTLVLGLDRFCPLVPFCHPLHPFSPPPPNITRLGDVWDHRTRCNVRRGGRERRKMGKNRVLPLGLIHKVQTKPAPKVNDSQRASRCRLRHDAAVHARGAARNGGWSAHGGSRRGRLALWRVRGERHHRLLGCGRRTMSKFAGAANTCGRTVSLAATMVAWALSDIIGTLGCHVHVQTVCMGTRLLGQSTSPRHNGGQWPQWQ